MPSRRRQLKKRLRYDGNNELKLQKMYENLCQRTVRAFVGKTQANVEM